MSVYYVYIGGTETREELRDQARRMWDASNGKLVALLPPEFEHPATQRVYDQMLMRRCDLVFMAGKSAPEEKWARDLGLPLYHNAPILLDVLASGQLGNVVGHHERRRGVTIRELQRQVRDWVKKNFYPDTTEDPSRAYIPLLGATEEAGELAQEMLGEAMLFMKAQTALGRIAHGELKTRQGIRGSAEEHAKKMKDAVGDWFIFMIDFCVSHRWDMQEIVEDTWAEVSKRDWTQNKNNGRPAELPATTALAGSHGEGAEDAVPLVSTLPLPVYVRAAEVAYIEGDFEGGREQIARWKAWRSENPAIYAMFTAEQRIEQQERIEHVERLIMKAERLVTSVKPETIKRLPTRYRLKQRVKLRGAERWGEVIEIGDHEDSTYPRLLLRMEDEKILVVRDPAIDYSEDERPETV